MSTDLLQALEIVTELGVDTVGEDLGVLAIDDIALTIEKPGWDLVLSRVLDDGDDSLEFFGGELTSTLVEIDIGLLANQVAVSTTNTLYLCQCVHDFLLSLYVCVEQTENVLEVRFLAGFFLFLLLSSRCRQTAAGSSVRSRVRVGSTRTPGPIVEANVTERM